MMPTFMICVVDFRDFPMHCDINGFVADLSWTLSQTSRHVEMVCVHDFPHGEVSVKVGVMEFGLYNAAFIGTHRTYPQRGGQAEMTFCGHFFVIAEAADFLNMFTFLLSNQRRQCIENLQVHTLMHATFKPLQIRLSLKLPVSL